MSIAAAFGLGGLAAGTQAASDLTNVLLGLYTNKQNIKEARRMFAMQTALANTAHQREVADLRAAGLNPILSSGTAGAPVPSQNAASVSAPSVDGPSSAINQMINLAAIKGDIAEQDIKAKFLKAHPEYIENKVIRDSLPKNEYEAAFFLAQKAGDKANDVAANHADIDEKPLVGPREPQEGMSEGEAYDSIKRNQIDDIARATDHHLTMGELWQIWRMPDRERRMMAEMLEHGEPWDKVWKIYFPHESEREKYNEWNNSTPYRQGFWSWLQEHKKH